MTLNGRTVFIREQRLYNIKALRIHLEEGDIGDDRFGEVLPHLSAHQSTRFVTFATNLGNEFFFNDREFFDHFQLPLA